MDDGIDFIDSWFATGAETGTLANHKGSETRESVIGLRVQRKVIVVSRGGLVGSGSPALCRTGRSSLGSCLHHKVNLFAIGKNHKWCGKSFCIYVVFIG